ncbi:hypothetical protein HDU87_005667 [Geranomyces variabilis]|uniref:Threonylcarbamoyl-AMP synthase n=1 Tax=Geranomyces variabilis TaxID=109894 RepID=A0AAD5TIU9_9FUNG|nr:hypothetical protein HDU87_005667 [Geranomyces variabilis]
MSTLPPPQSPPPNNGAKCIAVDPASFQFAAFNSDPIGAPLPPATPKQVADHAAIAKAAAILQTDQPVAFPTETVYGLAANALRPEAVARIFQAKGRPSDNPLIVHISSLEMLHRLLPPGVALPAVYTNVIESVWPGPLTILIPRGPAVPLAVTGGHDTVAVRFPSHPVARALIAACGFPLAAPSANTSGRPSPTLAAHVLLDLGTRIPLVLDGGPCSGGVESTVLDGLATPPVVLRPGGITVEMLQTMPGLEHLRVYRRDFTDSAMEAAPTTPGMKYRHYTPEAEVVLFETAGADAASRSRLRAAVDDEARRLATQDPPYHVGIMRTTSVPAIPDAPLPPQTQEIELGTVPAHVAQGLFAALRELEARGVAVILVEGVGEELEGLAVMNRIRKAASRVVTVL